MTYQITECSPKAKAKISSTEDKAGVETELTSPRAKYPWALLKIGECFTAPISEGNEASLRNGAAQYGKKAGKTFTVIRHKDYACFEVARIG